MSGALAAEERAQAVFEERNRAFRILYDTVWDVESVPEDELYRVLVRNLRRICRAHFAALGAFAPERGTLVLCATCRRGEEPSSITAAPCRPLDENMVRDLRERQVQVCDDHRLCLVALYPDILEPELGSGHQRPCYRLSCTRGGELMAVGLVQLEPGDRLRMKDMVDTYLSLAGMVIQRVNDVRTISEARDALERRVRERTRALEHEVQERRRAEEKYRGIFENALEGIFQVTDEGRFLSANPAMARILGYESPEELMREVTDAGYQLYADPGRRSLYLEALREEGSVYGYKERFVRRDGSVIWGSVTARLVEDPASGKGYIEGSFLDVTSQRRAEQALQQAKEEAEAASRMKSDFLALVSHELRTPLTSVVGFTKIIGNKLRRVVMPALDDSQTDERLLRTVAQMQQNLDVIVGEGERLTELINNVLDLSRLEAGRFEWRMEAVDPGEVLRRSLAATEPIFREKGLPVRCEVQKGLPLVLGDLDRLVQVVVNLLSNAAKFTEQGSVECAARLEDGAVVLSVRDTGVGIPGEMHRDIFDRFKQLGDTLTSKPKGTGLGLPISNEIVEHHGSRIRVQSEPGKGSTFSFALPLARA
jgi:PAS domain S-box-containing protein